MRNLTQGPSNDPVTRTASVLLSCILALCIGCFFGIMSMGQLSSSGKDDAGCSTFIPAQKVRTIDNSLSVTPTA